MDPIMKKNGKTHSEEKLLRIVEKNVAKRIAQSPILANTAVDDVVPMFALNELEIGRVLGRGAFSLVCDILELKVPRSEGPKDRRAGMDHCDSHFQDRKFMASNCLRGDGKDCRYAVKSLQDSMRRDPDLFVRSLVDIVVETRFLATVHHPNIIKMRAVANTSPYEPRTCYFVIMDKLYEMLSARMSTWKYRVHNKMAKLMDVGNKQKKKCWSERLSVLFDIGSALAFLHKMNIVYRDLKPDNIGFDVRGDVKIFDFGLARELQPPLRDKDGTFKMTGDVGSLRYMAPEVALGKPYNETCDVYSFSILMWQILKVEMPFELYDRPASFQSKVVRKGVRPKPDSKWPQALVDHMKWGWDVDIKQRPSMVQMTTMLDSIIFKETGEERSNLTDHSTNSVTRQGAPLPEKPLAEKLAEKRMDNGGSARLQIASDDKTEETFSL